MRIANRMIDIARCMQTAQLAIAFSTGYLLLDQISFIYPLQEFNITPWDPQPALAVALIYFKGRRWVPWIFLTVLVSEILVRDIQVPLIGGFILPGLLTCGYGLIAALLRGPFAISIDLSSRKDILNLASTISIGAAAAGVLYVLALCLAGLLAWDQFAEALFRFWLGDSIGMLVTLPLLLLLVEPSRRQELLALARNRSAALPFLLVIATLFTVFAREEAEQVKFFYLLFLPIIWIAARLGLAGALVAVGVIQLGIVITVVSVDHETIAVFDLQTLLLALVLTGLFLGVTVDEWRFASQRLARAQELSAVGEMATALAHELNQPLTALSTYADAIRLLARSAQAAGGPLVATADRIRRVATRCADIVARFRALAPAGASQMQPTGIEEPLRAAVEALQERVERVGADIELSIDEDIPHLNVNRERISLALRNLIANALEAASERREVTPKIQIEVRRESRNHILLTFRDTGRGVPRAMIDKIFEPFYSGKSQGMGLGLAVSRSIVESHGGRLWVEPADCGIVCMRLPV
jgi:two-component system, LuxR family, sensor kinase FixL